MFKGVPVGGKDATMALSTEKRRTNEAAPNIRGFLRPTVSSAKTMKLDKVRIVLKGYIIIG